MATPPVWLAVGSIGMVSYFMAHFKWKYRCKAEQIVYFVLFSGKSKGKWLVLAGRSSYTKSDGESNRIHQTGGTVDDA
jgi:hypothetical protein